MDSYVQLRSELEDRGIIENATHAIGLDGWTIRVYNKTTGLLEAFSSMKADYDQSVIEFIGDYMLGFS
jgi:hypothetical protein